MNVVVKAFFSLFFWGMSQLIAQPDSSLLNQQAPAHFRAVFYTSQGEFEIEAFRHWAPLGVDRFYQLLQSGYYQDNVIFRVQPEYVVQFGIANDSALNAYWNKRPIQDDPIQHQNLKGIVSYARDGANSRDTQLFINMQDNLKLDTISYLGARGFPPIGKVSRGFEVVQRFNAQYLRAPAELQDSIYMKGNSFLDRRFPGLDKIYKVKLILD